MITNFKIFENMEGYKKGTFETKNDDGYSKGPQPGDYVIIRREPTKIGVIENIQDFEFDYDYEVNYNEINMNELTYKGYMIEDEDDKWIVVIDNILHYSSDKDKIELIAKSNKFNL